MRPLKPDPAKDPTLDLERELMSTHRVKQIIGVDEAGRGAIAGPAAVGVHVFTVSCPEFPQGLRDSKMLSEKRRELLLPAVEEWGNGAVGFAEPEEIDQHGITQMLAQAARRALLKLHKAGIDVTDSVILLDGSHDWLSPALKTPLRVETRVSADRLHASVAAASMRAKVTRDRVMIKSATKHPAFGWESNKGYGSATHYESIRNNGLTDLHRKTWIK
ncbi:MAG TPA: ribonuclease HII [Microbacteriaceae bacterium]|nr:ribonuclease HII [Microbacteriaceae bacterium]